MSKIYLIRGLKVMLDMDLAGLYGVETKQQEVEFKERKQIGFKRQDEH